MTLLSMTGQGQGRRAYGAVEIAAEVRSVNNRHLKIQTRTSEGLSGLEARIEGLVRNYLRRGSLQINVQMTNGRVAPQFGLDATVLENYIKQSSDVSLKLGLDNSSLRIADLLALPGVISEAASNRDVDDELASAVLEAVREALEELNQMRQAEGAAMAIELSQQLSKLRELTSLIDNRAPVVVDEYRARLEKRLSTALAEVGAELREADLVREVLIMADRSDIREEIVRLQSHFDQFESLLAEDESLGRKLDFLIQEMFREANTIGSKAGDAMISQRVVDIKSVIEQMRELVQNLE